MDINQTAADSNTTTCGTKDKTLEDRAKNLEEWQPKPDDRVQFCCSVCGLAELTKFGRLEHKTVSTHEEVYYIPDPFVPFDVHKTDYRVTDFVIFGALCVLCKQPICVSKTCSIFYGQSYCLCCVQREQHAFPNEIIRDLTKRFNSVPQPLEKNDKLQNAAEDDG